MLLQYSLESERSKKEKNKNLVFKFKRKTTRALRNDKN